MKTQYLPRTSRVGNVQKESKRIAIAFTSVIIIIENVKGQPRRKQPDLSLSKHPDNNTSMKCITTVKCIYTVIQMLAWGHIYCCIKAAH